MAGCFPLAVLDELGGREAEPILILADWVYDGLGGPPIENGAILVRGGRVAAIGTKGDVELPAVSRLVVADGATVIPGLVDPAGGTLCAGSAGRVLGGLRGSLAAGVTSIVDEVGPEPLARALADWIGERAGGGWPRVFLAAGGETGGDDGCAALSAPRPDAALTERLAAGEAPEAAVRGLSLEPARATGLDAEIGSLERGKLADLVVIEGRLGEGATRSLPVANVMMGGALVGPLARAAPSADESASLARRLFFTKLWRPRLWWWW